eukprot:5892024-Alexandrium_andersonii.AAC.1
MCIRDRACPARTQAERRRSRRRARDAMGVNARLRADRSLKARAQVHPGAGTTLARARRRGSAASVGRWR